MKKYELQYLPLFYDDLFEAVNYITEHLHNPKAAADFIDAVENAILSRQTCAESFEPYPTKYVRRHTYYAIYVKNFVIYYVVLDHSVMEVRRILYRGRDRDELL